MSCFGVRIEDPLRGSRTKPKKIAARFTPLRTPGSESWRPMPSRDGHLIRAALVGIQPEVCRSATTGERRKAAINRGRWRDRSSLLPGRRLSRGRQALPSRWWSRGHAMAGDGLPRIVGRSGCDFASALRHCVRSAARAGAPRRRVCVRGKADPTGATPPGQAAPWSVWESARKQECQGGQRCSAAVKAKSEVQSEGSSPMRPCRPAERRTRTGAVRPCRLGGRRRTRTGWMRPCRLARRRRTRIRSVRPCRLCGRRRTRTVGMRPCRLGGRRRTRIRRHRKHGRYRLAEHAGRRWPRRPA